MKASESRKQALDKIKELLSVEDVDQQFNSTDGGYYSKDKFIVSWNGKYKGMTCEFSIDKVDSFYSSFSGYKAIYSVRNLFYEKQLKGFKSIERALIDTGLKLCSKKDKAEFFDKFVIKYNERLMRERENKTT